MINPKFCCWWLETCSLAMTLAPTITSCFCGVTLCVGYSCVHLCKGCVPVQLTRLTVHTGTLCHGCKALAFSSAYSLAQPRWWHWLSGNPRSWVQACWGRGGCWCDWESQSTPSRGRAYLWMYPKGPRVFQAELPGSDLSSSFTIMNWNPRQ